MKNLYRFLVGCIVCFFMIVLFSSVTERRVTTAAAYTPNEIELLLALPIPSQKQWHLSHSQASYDLILDSEDVSELMSKEWTSKLIPSGWKKLVDDRKGHKWVKGDSELFLSYIPFIRRTVALLRLVGDDPNGFGSRQVLEISLTSGTI